ncbi:helix-turn-helix domain-containing protein [Rathayibacter tanaceti]|uniref:Helix-turn-helix domain-containing protein n=2 Tax=Rathayibacter tanaceti TaxID=1671680 RepID=A0AAE6RH54_9MICO|nr:AraC family transcriptional regulator [Rathayibacter tanaceti]QHC54552.1 helix-turn-helix domain-containing protein [Rathayibacter tanaceti]
MAAGGRLRVFGDYVASSEVTFARIWHTAREVEREGRHRGVSLSLLVEGRLRVGAPGDEIEVQQGGGFLQWSSGAVPVRSEGRSGTVEVAVGREFFSQFFIGEDRGVTPVPAGLESTKMLLNTAIGALATTVVPGSLLWAGTREHIEGALRTVLTELGPPAFRGTTATAVRLLRRAYTAIEARCADPAFDARSLAADLSVSVSGLYAAFAETGVTPSRAIRSIRVAQARRMLARRTAETAVDYSEIAPLAGFGSASALVAALRADRGP